MDGIRNVLMSGGAYDGDLRAVEIVKPGEHFVYDASIWESEQRPKAIYRATNRVVTLEDGRRACLAQHVT